MNTGQMMMAIGAMLLLSTVMLRVNSNNLLNGTLRDEAQYGVLATSIASSLIEEATGKAFDAKSDSNSVFSLTELTDVGSLRPESAEVYPDYNDFDDFNGLALVDSSMPSAPFNVSCSVCYVNPKNINVASSVKTWHKKITVVVSSPYMSDTIVTSSIFSYWTFR